MTPARIAATLASSLALLGTGRTAVADRISPSAPPQKWERAFGDLRLVVGGSTLPNGLLQWPELYVGSIRVASYPGFFAQEAYASPDDQYLVALSNQGTSRYAIVVLDRQGRILFSRPHGGADLHYCERSVTNLRRWVDLERAEVKFDIDRDSKASPTPALLRAVSVRGCDGNVVSIGPPDAGDHRTH